jgi:hypothetical protein
MVQRHRYEQKLDRMTLLVRCLRLFNSQLIWGGNNDVTPALMDRLTDEWIEKQKNRWTDMTDGLTN